MIPYSIAVVAAALLVGAAGCGSTHPAPAPDVRGELLNTAEDTLDAAGLRYKTVGGGTFGVVVRSDWTVCRQSPAPKKTTKSVTLFVDRECGSAVPEVVGERLDQAERQLEAAGLSVSAHSLDGGPILVRRFWTVCSQSPQVGARASTIDLWASHDCWYDDNYDGYAGS